MRLIYFGLRSRGDTLQKVSSNIVKISAGVKKESLINKGYPMPPNSMAMGNVQFFRNLSIIISFIILKCKVTTNHGNKRHEIWKKTQNLMANSKFSAKFHYICSVIAIT